MALESRIRELDGRHRDLDEQIKAATQAPAVDAVRVSELKRQKLKLRDEIESLRRRNSH